MVMLIVLRIIQGIGWGFSTTATGTIATDLIPPNRRGEGMGYFGLSGNIALALGPTLGLALVYKISFSQLFLISALLGVVALVLSSFIHYRKVEQSPHKSTTVKFDLYEKSALQPSLLLFFITFTFGGIASFLPLHAAKNGVAGIENYFLTYALFLFISRLFSGKLYDLRSHLYLFPPGDFLIFISIFFLGLLTK